MIMVMIMTMIMIMIMIMITFMIMIIIIIIPEVFIYQINKVSINVVHVLTKSKAIKVEERMAKVSAGQYWITLSAWISTTGIFFCETFII